MASNRWVAIDPDILNHPLVGAGQPVAPADPTRGAYSRMEAWLWIICNASFADHTVTNRGRKMTLQRGDLLGAWIFLAHTFNWSRTTVRRWVDSLIEDKMLVRRALDEQAVTEILAGDEDTRSSNQATVLSIVNYWKFQFDGPPESNLSTSGTQSGTQFGTQNGTQSEELSASKIADKYILQQQQRHAVGHAERPPIRTHITIDNNNPSSSNNNPLSEPSSDAKPKRKKRVNAYSEAFEIFWTGYPDRTNNSKPRAFDEWQALDEPDQNAALASLPAFREFCRKEAKRNDYRPLHVERYLKYRRWEGFVQQGQTAKTPWWKDPEQLKRLSDDRWRTGIAKHTEGKTVWPLDELGPPPGHRDCKVPQHIIDELGLTELYTVAGIRRLQ